MIPGSRIIANCFDGVCEGGGDPDIEIPDAGFTQAIANATYTYSVSEDFTAPLPHPNVFTYNATGAGWACDNSFGGVIGPARYDNPWDSISVSINQTINRVSTYSMVQKIKTNPGLGDIYRPGTEITLCGGSAACYRYDFQGTSSVETLNTGQADIETVTGDIYGCCDVIPYNSYFQKISTGPSITRNCGVGSFYFLYACVARFDVPGLFLTIQSAGVAIGPWDIQVSGSIVMTSSTGVVLVYSGLLTSVVSQINADGYFTATIPGGVTSAVLTSDFETGSASVVSGSTTCQTKLILKKAGTPIAPSSQGCRAGFYTALSPGSGSCSIQFQKDQGYPDTEEGLLAWLAGEFSSPVLNFPDIPGGPGGCGFGMGYSYPLSALPYFPGEDLLNPNNCWTPFNTWSGPRPYKGNGTGTSAIVLTFDDATFYHQRWDATFTEVITQPSVIPTIPPRCVCPDLTNSGQTSLCGNNPNSISATGLGGIPSCASYYCDAPGSTCCPGGVGSDCPCDSCCCWNCGSFTETITNFTKTYSLFQSIEGSFTLS